MFVKCSFICLQASCAFWMNKKLILIFVYLRHVYTTYKIWWIVVSLFYFTRRLFLYLFCSTLPLLYANPRLSILISWRYSTSPVVSSLEKNGIALVCPPRSPSLYQYPPCAALLPIAQPWPIVRTLAKRGQRERSARGNPRMCPVGSGYIYWSFLFV